MPKNPKKYRIDESLLHKKRLGKHALSKNLVKGRYSIVSCAGIFYHYTSPEGLRGILQSRTLFFTDCQYLNDYKERISINGDLDLFWAKHKNEYDKEFYRLLFDYRMNAFEDHYYAYMESDRPYGMPNNPARCFVLSASLDRDSLSMWKYYSKNNSYDGYCIGLATYALTDEWIDRETGVAIEDGFVIYDANKKHAIIHTAVEKLYEQWCIYEVSDEFNKKIRQDFESWVAVISLFFKDECFSSENEYRFVAIAPTPKLNELHYDYDGVNHKMFDFRLANGLFIPYIRMPFFYCNKDCWAIRSIGIGPSMNNEQRKLGVEQFLKYTNYEIPDLQIYNSEIPLRY